MDCVYHIIHEFLVSISPPILYRLKSPGGNSACCQPSLCYNGVRERSHSHQSMGLGGGGKGEGGIIKRTRTVRIRPSEDQIRHQAAISDSCSPGPCRYQ